MTDTLIEKLRDLRMQAKITLPEAALLDEAVMAFQRREIPVIDDRAACESAYAKCAGHRMQDDVADEKPHWQRFAMGFHQGWQFASMHYFPKREIRPLSDDALLLALEAAQISAQMQKPWIVIDAKQGIMKPTNSLRRFASAIINSIEGGQS